ncbi:MAG: YkgJ family cysteine cluster protein [Crenarchaeota archaeon]|nr:YkgJ family cysteine cluster protein [Thermoproteota archaeon]
MVEIKGLTITTPLPHSFTCNNCGLCCEGPVELSENDYKRLKSICDDVDRHIEVRKRNGKVRRILRPVEKGELVQECIFLRREGDKRICSIYENRPSYCKLYPLFVAYSRNMRKMYVDILHCPEVRHENTNNMRDEQILDSVRKIFDEDPTFIEVIPNVDKAVVFTFYYRFRDIYLDWKLKYEIMIELNRILISEIRKCENSLQLMLEIYRFQEAVRESLRSINNIFNICEGVRGARRPHVSFHEFSRAVNDLLIVRALCRHGYMIIVDNYCKRVYNVKLSIDYFRNMYLSSEDLSVLEELLYRLSTNIQTCALPIEYIYTQGYLNIILLYLIYRGVCESFESCLYNLDAIGISVYSRELTKHMRNLGISYVELSEKM